MMIEEVTGSEEREEGQIGEETERGLEKEEKGKVTSHIVLTNP